MVGLLRRLRCEMNGAVSGAMEERGLNYGMNYGVSLPTIRKIAEEHSPNHEFAKFLYLQQVRELRISAMYIAQAQLVDMEEESFWRAGIQTNEYAEIIAMTIVGHSPHCAQIVTKWLEDPSEIVQYAALMSGSRSVTSNSIWDYAKISSLVKTKLDSSNVMLLRSIALFLTCHRASGSQEIDSLTSDIINSESKSCQYIKGELFID